MRGSILKELVKHKKVTLEEMKNTYEHKDFDEIVEKMRDEGLIVFEKGFISIAE